MQDTGQRYRRTIGTLITVLPILCPTRNTPPSSFQPFVLLAPSLCCDIFRGPDLMLYDDTSYAGNRRVQVQLRGAIDQMASLRKGLVVCALFFVLYMTIYTMSDLNNPGFSIIIELDESTPQALELLKRTLACIYESKNIAPSNVEIIVFCACSAPDDEQVSCRFPAGPAPRLA